MQEAGKKVSSRSSQTTTAIVYTRDGGHPKAKQGRNMQVSQRRDAQEWVR